MTEKEFKKTKLFVWLVGIVALFCWILAFNYNFYYGKNNTELIAYLFLGALVFTIAFCIILSSIQKYKKIKQRRQIRKTQAKQIS